MNTKQNNIETVRETSVAQVRAEWHRPELRKLEAREAEGGSNGGTDQYSYS